MKDSADSAQRPFRTLLFCSVALCASSVIVSGATAAPSGSTIRVEAPIVAIEPVMQEAPKICDLPAPPHSQGLVAALRWDLQGRCRPSQTEPVVTGYRVDYEWDGRRFSTLLAAKPAGDTLPLRLHLD